MKCSTGLKRLAFDLGILSQIVPTPSDMPAARLLRVITGSKA